MEQPAGRIAGEVAGLESVAVVYFGRGKTPPAVMQSLVARVANAYLAASAGPKPDDA